MRRIGIMGGTFDPVHQVHVMLGELAREEYHLDVVLFMPTGESYFKTREGRHVTPAKDRLEMVRLAVEDIPGLEVSDLEVRREGHTYTADTLQELCAKDPEAKYYFIVGADSLASMETWYLPEKIFSLAAIIVANRDNQFSDAELTHTINHLREKFGAEIHRLDFKSVDLSSSKIRDSLTCGNQNRSGLPIKVYHYIVEHNLYPESELDAGE